MQNSQLLDTIPRLTCQRPCAALSIQRFVPNSRIVLKILGHFFFRLLTLDTFGRFFPPNLCALFGNDIRYLWFDF